MEIKRTMRSDWPAITQIYERARAFMKENGNPTQWGDNRPTESAIQKDIEAGDSYVVCEAGTVYGVFSFIVGEDETYKVIKDGVWLNDEPYGVIHKIASSGVKKGILDVALDYAESCVNNVRIDTHKDNKVMQHLLAKRGYQYCGIIYTDDGTERLAYQKDNLGTGVSGQMSVPT